MLHSFPLQMSEGLATHIVISFSHFFLPLCVRRVLTHFVNMQTEICMGYSVVLCFGCFFSLLRLLNGNWRYTNIQSPKTFINWITETYGFFRIKKLNELFELTKVSKQNQLLCSPKNRSQTINLFSRELFGNRLILSWYPSILSYDRNFPRNLFHLCAAAIFLCLKFSSKYGSKLWWNWCICKAK